MVRKIMNDLFYDEKFSKLSLLSRYQFFKNHLKWFQLGWKVDYFYQKTIERSYYSEYKVGSPLFLILWKMGMRDKDYQTNLEVLLKMLDFPKELSGSEKEISRLMSLFSHKLSPEHWLWWDIAYCVNKVFPSDRLCHHSLFAKKIHQLRYLISCQQAQYIRDTYKTNKKTDKEVLICYLVDLENINGLVSFESARFHNKLNRKTIIQSYPEGDELINIKILINFHTEFILDSRGIFVNELDAEKHSLNGVINGASFNYGKDGKRHWQLDVYPVKEHDPKFRDKLVASYLSANTKRKSFLRPVDESYYYSYFNPKGFYSSRGKSMFARVRREEKKLKREVKKYYGQNIFSR